MALPLPFFSGGGHRERQGHGRGVLAAGVLWAGEGAADGSALAADAHAFTAEFAVTGEAFFAALREIEKRALGAAQVGDAHRGELHAVKLVGWKSDRHAQDGAEDARVAEHVPKRFAAAEVFDARPGERHAEGAELQVTRRGINANGGNAGAVGGGGRVRGNRRWRVCRGSRPC